MADKKQESDNPEIPGKANPGNEDSFSIGKEGENPAPKNQPELSLRSSPEDSTDPPSEASEPGIAEESDSSTGEGGEGEPPSDIYHDDPYHHEDYDDPDHHESDHESDDEDGWWEDDEDDGGDEEDQLSAEGEMSFLDHLEDLRWTLFKCIAAFVIGCIVVGFSLKFSSKALQFPIELAGLEIDLRTRQPLGVLMVLMQVILFGGLAVAMPFILLFISGFVAPGLTKREKRVLLPGSLCALFLFLAGAALAFFFIIPVSLKFSGLLNKWMEIELLWDVNDYYSLVVVITLAVGALFQFPLLIVFMGYLGILPSTRLKRARKMVFIIIMIVAALLTPGDVVVALVLLTVPLYLLFETSIYVVAVVEKRKARKMAQLEEKRKERRAESKAENKAKPKPTKELD